MNYLFEESEIRDAMAYHQCSRAVAYEILQAYAWVEEQRRFKEDQYNEYCDSEGYY